MRKQIINALEELEKVGKMKGEVFKGVMYRRK
uniref:Uncharacterized protein n=1 Tax=viral metagenome TaxID=1070528 RepID=A0A6C0F6B3_9ZZZZ